MSEFEQVLEQGRAVQRHFPDLLPSARLWKFLLEDLPPQLKLSIELRPEERSIGV